MLNLYYNAKITDNEIRSFNTKSLSNYFFHPSYFPICFDNLSLSKIDEFLHSINSLSFLKFNNAVFGILLDIDDSEKKKNYYKKIENIIKEKINTNKLVINYARPSTKDEWIKDISKNENLFKNDPVLIIMNHDHCLIPNYINFFLDDIKSCFLHDKEHQVMSYSHCPEILANIHSPSCKIGKKNIRKKINWIDSIYLMRIKTLKLLFKNLVIPHKDFYLGRIDWEGIYIKSTAINFYYCDKPYFYHLGGYSHVSGINLSQFVKANSNYIYLNGKIIGDLFCEWLKHYYLYLFKCFKKNNNSVFLKNKISETIDHYLSYANTNGNKLNNFEKQGLTSLIYSNFNSIYCLFNNEKKVISSKNKFLFEFFIKLIPLSLKIKLKKYISKIN